MNKSTKPVLLAILDGWGYSEKIENNSIYQAHTPNWDRLWSRHKHGLLNASELHVGLPSGQMGNSEVGHMNIGSGRVILQDLPKINQEIENGSLAHKAALRDFITKTKAGGGRCHIMGLLSPGGVHAHQVHIAALANILADVGIDVCVHAFLDGRDTPPRSAKGYLDTFIASLGEHYGKAITFATISGRFYAMDRDQRWERVHAAYDVMTHAKGAHMDDVYAALKTGYENVEGDEFITPVALGDYDGMRDGDSLLVANFRADRMRQILAAFLKPDFDSFDRGNAITFGDTLGMVEYASDLTPLIPPLFPPESLTGILGEVVSSAGLKQLRIAETEKYAHVTFFFNGGREEVFEGEERILVPSPKVATYDLKPEMSAYEVTEKLLDAIASDAFDLMVVNYANTDMVGHSGNLKAAIKAVEAVDDCLGKLYDAIEQKGGSMVITADHGNAEMMYDDASKQSHTAHTLNPVPVIITNAEPHGTNNALPTGKLGDIAPTILQLLGLAQPSEMTGQSLLKNHA